MFSIIYTVFKRALIQARAGLPVGSILLLFMLFNTANAVDPATHPRLQAIVDDLVEQSIYTPTEIQTVFAAAKFQQSVLDAMQSPAEYKLTWGKYRKIFMQEERYEQGVDFWLEHADAFTRAEQEYGVPASMIAAILGVESKFGRYKGKHKVLDSLVTLVVGFERRSKFFASELHEFLLLSKENQLNPTQILGSYAGAVGFPQFISSSYRNYAVDFNGDGITDLINQPVDAIGSIANYFVENGWQTGEAVTSKPHSAVPSSVAELVSRKRKLQHSAADLRALGAPIADAVPNTERLGVLMLNTNEIVPNSKDSQVYLVRAGDTACQIAERKKVSCNALRTLNKLNARGDIFRGQRLKLPVSSQPKSGSESSWELQNGDKQADPAREIPRYFFTHHNFYVITRYNQSVLYAMAVNDLSEAIAKAYSKRVASRDEGVQ